MQPLERVDDKKKANAKEEEVSDEISSAVQKPPPHAPPSTCVEHTLPGGIGTYSISHIYYSNNHRVPKPEASIFSVSTPACEASSDRNEENSNCSSYTGSGFTLWEESNVQKGKTGKENGVVGEKPVIAGNN